MDSDRVEAEIMALSRAWRAAIRGRDDAARDALMADDFTFTIDEMHGIQMLPPHRKKE